MNELSINQCSWTHAAVVAEKNNKHQQHAATVTCLQLQVSLEQQYQSQKFYLQHITGNTVIWQV